MTRKIVQSAERQLSISRARIQQLEAKNHQLETENHALRLEVSLLKLRNKKHAVLQQSTLRPPKGSCGSEYSSDSPLAEDLPSFARPTRASRLRQSRSPPSRTESTCSLDTFPSSSSSESKASGPKLVIVHGKPCTYHKGELVVEDFGFLRSTKAMMNRFGNMELRREESCGIFRPSVNNSWGSSLNLGALPQTAPAPCPEPPKPTQIMSRGELEDRVERIGIELRTRLDDNDWLSDPALNIRMDHDELFDILSRAEWVAKRCLWRWLRVNHPHRCIRMGLNYLSDMDLGRQVMESLSCGDDEMYRYRHTQSYEVHRSIEDVIRLRNRVHHFRGTGFTMEITDDYLYDVQNLAVKLYDEESARSARCLRDRLFRRAQDVAREIEAVRLLIELPFAGQHPWQHHHVELFAAIRASPLFGAFDGTQICRDYAPSFLAATQDWLEAGRPPSPEPDVDSSLARVQRLENGGHAGPILSDSEKQEDRVTHHTPPTRSRSVSMCSYGRVSFLGRQTPARDPIRRGSFSFGGSS